MTSSHVLITGTGRAGTTFIVELLTKLGLDTGFDPLTMEILPEFEGSLRGPRSYYDAARAGLEININMEAAPFIVKTPNMDLRRILQGPRRIEHVIIPLRDFVAAAASRIENQQAQTGSENGQPTTAGGLWGTEYASSQVEVLRIRFSEIVEACILNDIPITWLVFPRLMREPRYLYEELNFLLAGIDSERFSELFARIVRPDWVRPV